MQIPTISEDDEEANDTITKDPNDTSDEEVALWVKSALEKRAGGSQKPVDKPALHTAALDSVSAANVPKPVVEESAAA